MKIIAQPQCSEKTKELIKYAIDNNLPIFCLTETKRRSLLEKAQNYFGSSVWVIRGSELLYADCNAVLVDDAEDFIMEVINDYSYGPISLAGFSVSTENQETKIEKLRKFAFLRKL